MFVFVDEKKKIGYNIRIFSERKADRKDEKDICIQRYDEVRFVFYRRRDTIDSFRIGPDKRRQREYRPWLKGGIGVKTILFPSERRAENAYSCRFAKHGFAGAGSAAK